MSQTQPHFSATLGEVAAACAGRVSDRWTQTQVFGVSTDTRELASGELFAALTGARDGHQFVPDARAKGAAAALVSNPAGLPEDFPVVVVDDTLRALGSLAAWHRGRMPAKVGAITGSTGKTSTKDLLGAIMRGVGSSVVAQGTQNNEIGVPLTLLQLGPEDRYCVLELAMRGPGEIDYLARIARPEVGVITNIGQSHVGRLGSREAIAQVKAEILEHIAEGGAAVLNADDFFFSVFAAMAHSRVVSFGIEQEADVRALEVDASGMDGVRFRMATPLGEATVRMRVPGRHNVVNALAATAAAVELGASLQQVVGALEAFEGSSMRMQQVTGPGGSLILNDAYNASPDSVAAALAVLASASGRRIFVFGDMLEMGPEGEPAHREVGRAAAEAGVTRLVAVGELAALAAEEAGERGVQTAAVDSPEAAAELLRPELREGDVVLVKGSRSMGLEHAVEGLADDN